MAANELQRPVEVDAGFLVHRNPIRSGIYELGDVLVGVLNHEVAVERDFYCLAQGSYHRWTNRDVRDKMAVHHVHVQHSSAPLNRRMDLVGKMSKISR
jgi:uncharacterized membrane protein